MKRAVADTCSQMPKAQSSREKHTARRSHHYRPIAATPWRRKGTHLFHLDAASQPRSVVDAVISCRRIERNLSCGDEISQRTIGVKRAGSLCNHEEVGQVVCRAGGQTFAAGLALRVVYFRLGSSPRWTFRPLGLCTFTLGSSPRWPCWPFRLGTLRFGSSPRWPFWPFGLWTFTFGSSPRWPFWPFGLWTFTFGSSPRWPFWPFGLWTFTFGSSPRWPFWPFGLWTFTFGSSPGWPFWSD